MNRVKYTKLQVKQEAKGSVNPEASAVTRKGQDAGNKRGCGGICSGSFWLRLQQCGLLTLKTLKSSSSLKEVSLLQASKPGDPGEPPEVTVSSNRADLRVYGSFGETTQANRLMGKCRGFKSSKSQERREIMSGSQLVSNSSSPKEGGPKHLEIHCIPELTEVISFGVSFKDSSFHICVCDCVCMYLRRPGKGTRSFDAGLQMVVCHLTQALGTGLSSSERATSAPKCWAMPLAPATGFSDFILF